MADDAPSETFLQDVWTYYFHDPDDPNWNLNSYHRLHDVATLQDFWDVHSATASFLSRGMFFVMREHVYPCWDDPLNITGGCLSMKVLKEDMPAFWEHLMVRMLGETLLVPDASDADPERWSAINGMSVSPKRFFCIVKLWLRRDDLADRRHYDLPAKYNGEILFRLNAENIKTNNMVVAATVPGGA